MDKTDRRAIHIDSGYVEDGGWAMAWCGASYVDTANWLESRAAAKGVDGVCVDCLQATHSAPKGDYARQREVRAELLRKAFAPRFWAMPRIG